MRICLATTYYPPENTGGIPRQRQILANALAKMGHEVHVITQGRRHETNVRNRVIIHTVPFVQQALLFSEKYLALNYRLTHSLAIQEQIRVLNQDQRLDVLDVPLWGLEGFVPIYADEIPVALWLQTSFAQLVAMGQQPPRVDDAGVIAFEKECLRRARGIIADSQTVLSDFEELYGLTGLGNRSKVVHLGLPDLPESRQISGLDGNAVEALLVGRLEKRKGTPFIFEILADLLSAEKRLRVRFIGADNSQWDGFYRQYGETYPEYFHHHWPGLRGRVIFEGAVTDRRLNEAYRQADFMLVPSLYESFGLIYLEAMRAGLPIITFRLGAAAEIFARGEQDGAMLVPPEDIAEFKTAVQTITQDQQLRLELGTGGRQRFLDAFLDTHMAEATASYYREIADDAPKTRMPKPRRIFQVMEALDLGDAVSSIALRNADLLKQMGAGGTILSQHVHPLLMEKSRPIDRFDIESHSALIFHYWNYSYLQDFVQGFSGPKAIHFHNITPPEFFSPGSPGYEATSRGYAQLPSMLNLFDLLIGVSTYNLDICKPFLREPKPGVVVPPVIDVQEVKAREYDPTLLTYLRKQPGIKLLFVGRIVRNKRQDRLIELYSTLSHLGVEAWLYLVGNDQGDPDYRVELEELRKSLPNQHRVVITGKVSDKALYSYYRAADIFISASEHEGFGVPLIEAMAFDLPVVAYAAGAVPETLGETGVLVREWSVQKVVNQVDRILNNSKVHEDILIGQRHNLLRFRSDAVMKHLLAVIDYLDSRAVNQEFVSWIKCGD